MRTLGVAIMGGYYITCVARRAWGH